MFAIAFIVDTPENNRSDQNNKKIKYVKCLCRRALHRTYNGDQFLQIKCRKNEELHSPQFSLLIFLFILILFGNRGYTRSRSFTF